MSVSESIVFPEDKSSLIPLAPGEIHLWLAYYDEINDGQLHDKYRALMSEAERSQEPRFYFAKDRRRYLVTRALTRTVLSRYVAVEPKEWVFTANEYGRPQIANGLVSDAAISFNISHTHSLIVLGVTRQRALGVDVENWTARDISLDIANHYFSPDEVSALSVVPIPQQQYRFFEYWTFKESYIKARGMGLSLPLDKFSFHYPSDTAVSIAIHPQLSDEASRWMFWQFRPQPQYLVAVCAERESSVPTNLSVRQVVPLGAETMLAPELTRRPQ